MMWTQLKVRAFGLTIFGLVVIGAVASQSIQAQSPPVEPGVKQGTPRPKGGELPLPQVGREEEVEALKKEIEALRKKVAALDKKEEQPRQDRQKIVVTSPMAKEVVITQQYACQIHAQRHINICALTSGVLNEIQVKEGQTVKKGDVLFKVSSTLYQAKLDVELAEVQLAQIEFNNTDKLFREKVVSATEVTLIKAKLAKAQAKAKLAEAELSFTVVKAPFDGIIGRQQMQQGSLAKEGDALATLSDNSQMWVYFNVPEARYLEYMANREQIKEESPIELVLANGGKFSQAGKLGAIEAKFSDDTGNISFRADFPNPDRLLRHGQTGIVLVNRTTRGTIVIPQQAMFEIRNRHYVYVIDKDNVAHRREIVIQNELEGIFVIKSGLEVNDKIIIEGGRQVRDGEKVEYEFRKAEESLSNQKIHPE